MDIIVVSYRTRELTLECLRSVMRETKHASYELLVVDNASDDGSAAAIAEEFPGIRLMARSGNVGFARANNIAAKEAKGRYLLLLNPDTVVIEGGIDRLIAFAEARPNRAHLGRTHTLRRRLAEPDLLLAPHDAVERALPHDRPDRTVPIEPALQLQVLTAAGIDPPSARSISSPAVSS